MYLWTLFWDQFCVSVATKSKGDLQSLDFIVNRFFMKLFCTKYMSVVKCCQQMFHVELKSDIIKNRSVVKFESKCDILSVSQVYFLFLVKGFLCLLCYLCGESRWICKANQTPVNSIALWKERAKTCCRTVTVEGCGISGLLSIIWIVISFSYEMNQKQLTIIRCFLQANTN